MHLPYFLPAPSSVSTAYFSAIFALPITAPASIRRASSTDLSAFRQRKSIRVTLASCRACSVSSPLGILFHLDYRMIPLMAVLSAQCSLLYLKYHAMYSVFIPHLPPCSIAPFSVPSFAVLAVQVLSLARPADLPDPVTRLLSSPRGCVGVR